MIKRKKKKTNYYSDYIFKQNEPNRYGKVNLETPNTNLRTNVMRI